MKSVAVSEVAFALESASERFQANVQATIPAIDTARRGLLVNIVQPSSFFDARRFVSTSVASTEAFVMLRGRFKFSEGGVDAEHEDLCGS